MRGPQILKRQLSGLRERYDRALDLLIVMGREEQERKAIDRLRDRLEVAVSFEDWAEAKRLEALIVEHRKTSA